MQEIIRILNLTRQDHKIQEKWQIQEKIQKRHKSPQNTTGERLLDDFGQSVKKPHTSV